MTAKPPRKTKPKRVPSIVPRFLKRAVTIGAIPTVAAACTHPQRPLPVVAAYVQPMPPVVAAYVPPAPRPDAGVDAGVPPADAKSPSKKL